MMQMILKLMGHWPAALLCLNLQAAGGLHSWA
jgi:hypothetical protein